MGPGNRALFLRLAGPTPLDALHFRRIVYFYSDPRPFGVGSTRFAARIFSLLF